MEKIRFRAWGKNAYESTGEVFLGEENSPAVAVAKALAKENGLSLANIHRNGATLLDNGSWVEKFSCTVAERKRLGFANPITIEFELI